MHLGMAQRVEHIPDVQEPRFGSQLYMILQAPPGVASALKPGIVPEHCQGCHCQIKTKSTNSTDQRVQQKGCSALEQACTTVPVPHPWPVPHMPAPAAISRVHSSSLA